MIIPGGGLLLAVIVLAIVLAMAPLEALGKRLIGAMMVIIFIIWLFQVLGVSFG